jgi:hypothetical protein
MEADQNGKVRVVLVGDDTVRDFAVALTYKAATLPHFIEWKMTGEGHFVLGLEPANCGLAGRKAQREAGTLHFLKPGEQEEFLIELRVLDGVSEVKNSIASISC